MADLKGDYFYRELPNLSKSRVKTWKFCKYCFWKEVVLREETKPLVKAIIGTNTHLIFAEFFKYFDFEYVFENVELDAFKRLEDNDLTQYCYAICMNMVPEQDQDVEVIKRVLWKFALLEAGHFYYLYNLFKGEKTKIKKYFFPKGIEQHIFIDDVGLYGTIDRVMETVYEDKSTLDYICDYKSGHVPKSVLRGLRDPDDETSWKLPTNYMFEIHFYMILYLLENGWEFSEKVQRFINNNEYYKDGKWYSFGLGRTEEEQDIIDDAKSDYFTSLGEDYKLRKFDPEKNRFKILKKGDVLGGIIYLTVEPHVEDPIPTKKKFNYRSYKSVIMAINELKSVTKNIQNDKYFLVRDMKQRPEYDHWRCRNCSRNEVCLKESEAEQINGGV